MTELIQPEITETADSRSSLEKLNSGLLMLYFNKEIKESQYSVLDRITFGRLVLQKRQSYSSEIIRVLEELNLTASLLENIDVGTTININGKIKQPEELINYYTGIFFGLVHQAKDKVLRLVDYMDADEETMRPYQENKKMNPRGIIKKHSGTLDKIGIKELIEKWGQENGSIAVILKKRTQHEHFTSNIHLNDDLQKLGMTRTMLNPMYLSLLSVDGIAYMKKLGKESFEKYRNNIVSKRTHAISVITNNINVIAQKLISYHKIPESYKDQAELAAAYMDYLGSLEIKNEASKEKFASNAHISLNELLAIQKDVNDEVLAIYGAGSVFRDEFNEGHLI